MLQVFSRRLFAPPHFPSFSVFLSSENLPSHQTHTPVLHCQPSPTLPQPLNKESDWMMLRCRYPALLKSIFLSVCESLAPASLLPFPLPSSVSAFLLKGPVRPVGLVSHGVAVGCTLECRKFALKILNVMWKNRVQNSNCKSKYKVIITCHVTGERKIDISYLNTTNTHHHIHWVLKQNQ